MVTGRISILSLVAILFADATTAQTISLTPSDPKRWDTSVAIGWLGGNKDEIAGDWNDWYDTFATSVDVGRYWTPHLKTEVAATLTTTGTVYSFVSPHEHEFGFHALNVSAVYQAFENSWAHPFVGGGVQLGSERQRTRAFEPRPPGGPVTLPIETTRTAFDVRPFLSGGTKFYVTEQGFIRTDLSAAFDNRGATRVWWRIGGGIDF
jgi:hypothetical protein